MILNASHGGASALASLDGTEPTVRRIAAVLAECLPAESAAISLVDNGRGRWSVAIHFRDPPDEPAVRALAAAAAGEAAAAALRFERVAARDWVRESLAGLTPVGAGRFIIHGAHDRARFALNRIAIEIEASSAFGTGHHGTTRGCLLALERMCKVARNGRHPSLPPQGGAPRGEQRRVRKQAPRILDLGTGSGVLAIAAARALRSPVLATDIDAGAVRVARNNARLNRAGSLVDIIGADGVARRSVQARAPFDLVFANILLGPLQRLAAPLGRMLAPGGRLVLSGLLAAQANAAISAYRPHALEYRLDLDGWTTLVLRRAAPSRARPVRHSRP